MEVDPSTTVATLLAAIPSSTQAFEKLGLRTAGNESKSVQQVCADEGIAVEQFLRAMDEINWNAESIHRHNTEHNR